MHINQEAKNVPLNLKINLKPYDLKFIILFMRTGNLYLEVILVSPQVSGNVYNVGTKICLAI